MTTWRITTFELGNPSESVPIETLRVGRDFLRVTGFGPHLGRGFIEEDQQPGAPDVALVSSRIWQERFGGSPEALGESMVLDGRPHMVVGVLPGDFSFPQARDAGDVLVPLRLEPDPTDEGENWPILARLAEGVSREAATADLERVTAAFRTAHPELINAPDRGMALATYQDLYTGSVGGTLVALMAATVLVLVIACANVAALLLARGERRRTELAVRKSLGASGRRLLRHLLAESLVLAGVAFSVGLWIAHIGIDVLLGLYPAELPRESWIGLNGAVLAYTGLTALLTGVVFGTLVGLPALREGGLSALRSSNRWDTGRSRTRQILLGAEAAVSVVLLVGAGLLIATVSEIQRVDPGYTAEGVVVARIASPPGGWESRDATRAAERETIESLRNTPGVVAAATASTYPLSRGMNIPVGIQGQPESYEGAVEWRSISPEYMKTLEIEVLQGRDLSDADIEGSAPVALVNRSYADRFFPAGDAVGSRIEIGRYRDRYVIPSLDVGGVTIVGVVEDVRETSMKSDARRTVFVPRAQEPEVLASTPTVVTRLAPGTPTAVVTEVLSPSDRDASAVRPLTDVVRGSMAAERFNALLMVVFAGLALLLTALGIYGVVSYQARQRTREIGIRLALGATPPTVAGLVLRQGMTPVLVGMALGTIGAIGLARFIEGLLWGVEPTDPSTIATVIMVLGSVAAAACWLPVREAASTPPGESLRPE